jgi:PKD repeat protein
MYIVLSFRKTYSEPVTYASWVYVYKSPGTYQVNVTCLNNVSIASSVYSQIIYVPVNDSTIVAPQFVATNSVALISLLPVAGKLTL